MLAGIRGEGKNPLSQGKRNRQFHGVSKSYAKRSQGNFSGEQHIAVPDGEEVVRVSWGQKQIEVPEPRREQDRKERKLEMPRTRIQRW